MRPTLCSLLFTDRQQVHRNQPNRAQELQSVAGWHVMVLVESQCRSRTQGRELSKQG
ncbi:UNVERIFIED_CONTAM: hypothetical protein FKN15_008031 [Acipenser sinensis]